MLGLTYLVNKTLFHALSIGEVSVPAQSLRPNRKMINLLFLQAYGTELRQFSHSNNENQSIQNNCCPGLYL